MHSLLDDAFQCDDGVLVRSDNREVESLRQKTLRDMDDMKARRERLSSKECDVLSAAADLLGKDNPELKSMLASSLRDRLKEIKASVSDRIASECSQVQDDFAKKRTGIMSGGSASASNSGSGRR